MSFTIPTIYTAIDKMSPVISKINSVQGAFVNKVKQVNNFMGISSSGIARQERLFRRLTPAIGEAGNNLLSYFKAAAVAGWLLATLNFSIGKVVQYDSAVASFRTIVSDLSDTDFSKFTKEIGSVAKASKGMASTVDVAQSFEKIAGLNADFAKTADGLGKVSSASIMLAKASGMELGDSAENLVGIMNQFTLGADQANRAINVLAAGQAVGAASISQTSESLKVFGAVAAGSNVSLEQSVALVETLAKKQIMGSEAGTALRGVFVRLQKAHMGYKSGVFQINDALVELRAKLNKIKDPAAKDAAAIKIFGTENLTAGKILLDSIPTYQDFVKGVSGTSEAQRAASINSDTLSSKIEQLKNKWTTFVTTNDKANGSLNILKAILNFVIKNFDTILVVGLSVLGFFAVWKAYLIGAKIALATYNAIVGIATAVQWAWNAAMDANPIGLIILAIVALIAVIVSVIKYWDSWGKYVNLFLGPLGMVIELIQSFRRNWDNIKKAFKDQGILGGIKAIGVALLDFLLSPIQHVLELLAHLPGKLGDWAKKGAESVEAFRKGIGANTDDSMGDKGEDSAPLINPAKAKAQSITQNINTTNKQQLEILLKGNTTAADVTKNTGGIPIKTTSTLWAGK